VQLTSLLSAKAGSNYNRTDYQTSGPDQQSESGFSTQPLLPGYSEIRCFDGFTYNEARPDGGGPTGKDLYYNVGLRAVFTPKLTTEFTVGEQTRMSQRTRASTSSALTGPRTSRQRQLQIAWWVCPAGFSMSALGQSLVNGLVPAGSYEHFAPQWQVGQQLPSYLSNDGPAILCRNHSCRQRN